MRARAASLRRRAALGAIVGSAAAGCTLLIPFDEIPSEDAGADASIDVALAERADADADAGADAAPFDAAPEADVLDLDALTSCEGKSSGLYCGNNQIDYPGSKDDLVMCDGGKVWQVQHCDGGSGCIRMPNPQPDQCDECWRKANGYYCGRDMPGWAARNDKLRVRCMAGGSVGVEICPNDCVSNGAQSTCQ
jgi:hypothetical protein